MRVLRTTAFAAVSIVALSAPSVAETAPARAGKHVVRPKAAAPTPAKAAAVERGTLALTLSDAVFIALRKNTTIRSAYVNRVAQLFDLRVADDIFTPQAAIAGGVARQTTGGVTSDTVDIAPTVQALTPIGTTFGFTWDNSFTHAPGQNSGASLASFNVAQPLLKGAGLDVNLAPVKAAHLADDMNRLALRATITQTVTDVISAFRNLQSGQEARKLAVDAVTRAQGLIDTDQALIAAGRLARNEIVQAQAQLESQKLAVLQTDVALDSARLSLATLLDLQLGTRIVARDQIEVKHITVTLATALPIALANRPDYLSLQDSLEQARLGIITADNQRLWNLSLVGSGTMGRSVTSVSGARPVVTKVASAAVGLQLSGPINSLLPEQTVVHAETTKQTLDIQYGDAKRAIEQQIRLAVETIELNWQQVEASRRLVALAASAIDIEKQKLSVGRSTVFQVQSLETSYTASLSQELAAETAYAVSLTLFDQQLGTTLETWKISIAGQ